MELLSASRGFSNAISTATPLAATVACPPRMSWLPIARWIMTFSPSPTTAK